MVYRVDGRIKTTVYHRDLTQFRNFSEMVLALRLHIQKNLGNDQWTLEENDVVTLLNKYECGEILQAIRNVKDTLRAKHSDIKSYYGPELIDMFYDALDKVHSKSRGKELRAKERAGSDYGSRKAYLSWSV